ncbi:MAG TPA: GNAT family N-acetyltransferase [Pyrinomonadaceae bacterium]|nr:GNAT family N-acetyltransferase [Pyrinomonadaceae bacterium]
MSFKIVEETPDALSEYEKIPISFKVESYFRVELRGDGGLGGIRLIEEPVAAPYVKDYDANENYRPSGWRRRFDISHWGILSAVDGEIGRVGGAAIAWNTLEVEMLEGLQDLACLWDLRVHPRYRGRGVGHGLFEYTLGWARARKCRRLLVETQNINVPACRFYARQGCELGAINRYAYPESLNETQLLWYRNV